MNGADSPTSTHEIFSDVAMKTPGMRRSIAVHARAGDDPVLVIGRKLNRAPVGAIYIHRRNAGPLAEAVRIAVGPQGGDGRTRTGTIPMRTGAHIQISAVARGGQAAVAIQLVAPTGRCLGKPSVISGNELVALERAVAALVATNNTVGSVR